MSDGLNENKTLIIIWLIGLIGFVTTTTQIYYTDIKDTYAKCVMHKKTPIGADYCKEILR